MQEYIYGRQPVLEVLRAGCRQVSGLALSNVRDSDEVSEILRLAEAANVKVTLAEKRELDRMSGEGHHQGVCVSVSLYRPLDEKQVLAIAEKRGREAVLLVLDHIQDPQNTGALIRSAECLGVDAVIMPSDRAAGITPAVVRASAGATEYMAIAVVVNLVRTMKSLKDKGIWFYGLDAGGESRPLSEVEFSDGTGIVTGSEGCGMSRLVRENCDFLVRIPMTGRINSLNASVSGAIVMHDVIDQKRESRQKNS